MALIVAIHIGDLLNLILQGDRHTGGYIVTYYSGRAWTRTGTKKDEKKTAKGQDLTGQLLTLGFEPRPQCALTQVAVLYH